MKTSRRRPVVKGPERSGMRHSTREAIDLLTDVLGELLCEEELHDDDLRATADLLLPTLYDALREAGYGTGEPADLDPAMRTPRRLSLSTVLLGGRAGAPRSIRITSRQSWRRAVGARGRSDAVITD